MAITPNMNLDLPTPTVTLGPTWATDLNTALTSIDEHDHSSGKGVKITPAGLNINATLDIQSQSIINVNLTKYDDLSSPLTGASNARTTHVASGDLYFTNNAGTAVQITSGGSVVTVPGSVETVDVQDVTSDLVIGAGDSFVYLTVDTTATRQITLPLASSVAEGRIYLIKDKSGNANTNNITIVTQGSDTVDGSTSTLLTSNYSTSFIVGDGVSAWYIS